MNDNIGKKKYIQKYGKKFEEERAREILQLFFPFEFHNSYLSERPDIICKENGIGVEVTSSVKQEVCEKASKAQSIYGKTDNNLTENDKKNILNDLVSCEKVFNNHFFDSVGYIHWGNTHDLITIFLEKIKKLNNTGFQKFKDNRLFIFSWLSNKDEINEFIEFLRENTNEMILCQVNCNNIFDVVYVMSEKSILEIALDEMRNFQKLPMNPTDMNKISEQSFSKIYGSTRNDFYNDN